MTEFKKGDIVVDAASGKMRMIIGPASYKVMHMNTTTVSTCEPTKLRLAYPSESLSFTADMLTNIKKHKADLDDLASILRGDMDDEEWEQSARSQRCSSGKP